MLNLIDTQDKLKNFSEEQLIKEMQMPSGSAPQFLVLGEINRRQKMRQDAQRQQGMQQSTVAQDAVAAAGVPQGGLGDMARAMAPKTDVAGNTGIAAAAEPQRMAEGGRVNKEYPSAPAMWELSNDPALIAQANRMGMSVTEYVRTLPSDVVSAHAQRIMRGKENAGRVYDDVFDPNRPAYSQTTPAQLDETLPQMRDNIRDQEVMGMGVNPSFAFDSAMRDYGMGISDIPLGSPDAEVFDATIPSAVDRPDRVIGSTGGTNYLTPRMSMPTADSGIVAPEGSLNTDLDNALFRMYGNEGDLAYGPESRGGYREGEQYGTPAPELNAMEALYASGAMDDNLTQLGGAGEPTKTPDTTSLDMFSALEAAGGWDPEAEILDINSRLAAGDLDQYERSALESRKALLMTTIRAGDRATATGEGLDRFAAWTQDVDRNVVGPVISAFSTDAGADFMRNAAQEAEALRSSADESRSAREARRLELEGFGQTTGEPLRSGADLLPPVVAPTPDAGTTTPPGGIADVLSDTTGGAGGAGGAGGSGGSGGGAGGGAGGMSSYEEELMNILKSREASRDQDKWLALAEAGLAMMASKDPNFGVAAGEAGLRAAQTYRQSRDQYDNDRLAIMKELEAARLARATLAARRAGSSTGLTPYQQITVAQNQREAALKEYETMSALASDVSQPEYVRVNAKRVADTLFASIYGSGEPTAEYDASNPQ